MRYIICRNADFAACYQIGNTDFQGGAWLLVNAGYAVIPMCFCFVFVGVYSGQKKKQQKDDES